MNPEDINATTGAVLGVIALLGVFVGWLKWLRPKIRSARQDGVAIRDAILGRDPVVDSITGKEIAPALPGMGVRMAHQEQQMDLITRAVAQLASTHTRIDNHETRIQKLEEASVERVVTRAESAAAWRAMEAAHLSDPPMDLEPDPDADA